MKRVLTKQNCWMEAWKTDWPKRMNGKAKRDTWADDLKGLTKQNCWSVCGSFRWNGMIISVVSSNGQINQYDCKIIRSRKGWPKRDKP
jgi:hypothetical protein